MKSVLKHIEQQRQQFIEHPFIKEIVANRNLSGEQRLCWAPVVIPFMMGYSDFNKYIIHQDNNNSDPIQAELNAHAHEEDSHFQWMLNDLDVLGINHQLLLADAARFFWSEHPAPSRILLLKLAQLTARYPEPYQVYALVEAIEAISITVFSSCRDIRNKAGQACEFYGEKHYQAEANHDIHEHKDSDGDYAANLSLTTQQQQLTTALVDETFALFNKWSNSLLQFAQTQIKLA
jgi:hypothetical protein